VVHVVGQGPVSTLFPLPSRNWLLTIHGAAPYSLPPELHPRASQHLEDLRSNASQLRHVICPSFAARREISTAYGIPLSRLHPVPHFFDAGMFTPVGPRHDAGRPYFLVVSNYQPTKNYLGVLEGLRLFVEQSDSEASLLFVGGHGTSLDELLASIPARWPALAGRVEFVGHARPGSSDPNQPDLAALYRGAVALVSASHHESFGMPYMEAALCGTAVIGPKRSMRAAAWAAQATQEILSGTGLYVDPEHPQDLATAMATLVSDPEARAMVAKRCLERARFYVEPEFLVRRYLHIYTKVLAEGADA
jgi:glycosyltransferase involved in cell wall biosynthesis